tara:strand:- start:71 stop:448 length:378 start_codon:yes stop_codon:yes gene_type:complete
MKKKKTKWYLWSKLTKGELANEYEKLKTKSTKLQSDLDFANEQNNVWRSNCSDLKKENEKLRTKLREEENYTLRSKIHLLEKLVALHEKKPKDEVRYIPYGNNGVVTTNTSGTGVTTASSSYTTY